MDKSAETQVFHVFKFSFKYDTLIVNYGKVEGKYAKKCGWIEKN